MRAKKSRKSGNPPVNRPYKNTPKVLLFFKKNSTTMQGLQSLFMRTGAQSLRLRSIASLPAGKWLQ